LMVILWLNLVLWVTDRWLLC